MVDDKSSIAKPKRVEINKIADKLILGHSQFNEILLLLGFDRVYPGFFQFLVDGTIEYKDGSAIESLQALESGIERFRTLALLWYGNIKFAFKALSKDPYELLLAFNKVDFSRHSICNLEKPVTLTIFGRNN